MKKSLLSLCLVIILILSVVTVPAGAYAPSEFSVNAQHCMLVNTDTNEILYKKNIDEKIAAIDRKIRFFCLPLHKINQWV